MLKKKTMISLSILLSLFNPSSIGAEAMSIGFDLRLFDLVTYENLVHPARQAYVKQADSSALIGLLENVLQLSRRRELAQDWHEYAELVAQRCENHIAILQGKTPIPDQFRAASAEETRRNFSDGWVIGKLIEHLCETQNGERYGSVDMSGALPRYLFDHSHWIEEKINSEGLDGGRIEEAFGEPSYYFSRDELRVFEQELRKVPRPEKRPLSEEYDRLIGIIQKALSSDRLVLVRLWG